MVTTRFRISVLSILFISLAGLANAQRDENAKKRWVDDTYNSLKEEERIGQLFMVSAYSGGPDYNEDKITKLINDHQVGGLIFMQGGPARQAILNNKYQNLAQVPLLIAMDAEWGLGMRLDSVGNFPKQMMLGATRDTALAFAVGVAIGKQCKRLGVHIDFAPVVDVNNNPGNPVINARSYGEDKTRVARMAIAYMNGLQSQGIIACAKHFPGHGDTDVDSHKDLPVIKKSMAQLEALELYPFKELMNAGVKSMMVAHLEVPALETEPHVPTTLSKNTITNLLKKKMGFKGLVFTDALNMKGVTKYYGPGEVALRAFMAGNDMLLIPEDVPAGIAKIKEALDKGEITEEHLESSVKKILAAKYDVGLTTVKRVNPEYAVQDLNDAVATLRTRVANKAITLVTDKNKMLDKIAAENTTIGYVGVNADKITKLYEDLQAALQDVKSDWLPKGSSTTEGTAILNSIGKNDATVVAIHNTGIYPTSKGFYGLDEQQMDFVQKAARLKNVIIVHMGNPYLLGKICDAKSAIVAYEDDTLSESSMARALLGEKNIVGMLPVSPCASMKAPANDFIVHETVKPRPAERVKHIVKTEFTEDAGVVNPDMLQNLDMFIQRSIVDGAFPGCRILASKNGKIFYDKSFGYYTFTKTKAVDDNTLYDVASVTKVLATTLAVMKLYETGKLDLNKTLGDYLPWTKNTNKAGLHIKDMLMHQAGLKSWIPFYKETVDANGEPRSELYKKQSSKNFSIEVAKNLYLRNDYVDTVWERILSSPLENKGKYVYSDLAFYFLAAVVEKITGKTIDRYVDEQFYKPMGLKNITYLPLKKFDAADIAPTENDQAFRHQLLQGYVHDPGAAMFGGVAGHAGIFATAGDVAAIFQMLLNKGSYNGKDYFKKGTVDLFTAYHSAISRRGYGFDKPSADKDDGGPASAYCTGATFGHQGFTGTCAWADPGTGVVFVFLSNRVCPSADNNKINHLSVRTVAQDDIYQSLGLPQNKNRKELYQKEVGKVR